MATRKITAKVIKEASGTHTGRDGDLLFDDSTNKLAISDGTTAGGVSIKRNICCSCGTDWTYQVSQTQLKCRWLTALRPHWLKTLAILIPANGAAITATLPAAADSEIGDVIKVQYNAIIANGATHKYGTAGDSF